MPRRSLQMIASFEDSTIAASNARLSSAGSDGARGAAGDEAVDDIDGREIDDTAFAHSADRQRAAFRGTRRIPAGAAAADSGAKRANETTDLAASRHPRCARAHSDRKSEGTLHIGVHRLQAAAPPDARNSWRDKELPDLGAPDRDAPQSRAPSRTRSRHDGIRARSPIACLPVDRHL